MSDSAQDLLFRYPDSVYLPRHFGVADRMNLVARLAADVLDDRAARALPWAVEWPAGFWADAGMLHRHIDYRGPAMATLATALAGPGQLTRATIGAAARNGRHDPQNLKTVWHCRARFGNRNGHPGFR
ncbi:DUF3626 domain-containing protein [Cupriavidus sp. D384]|uniref:DUF3626 domain-containing protein n=1 Tax=Cupriavidus sp. D384 TaxID=1538095 RepID=UPI0008326BB1|nr:DUF3626 domain-containing protein [Cupriavidus sp. D384]